jgi:hypothetical protein
MVFRVKSERNQLFKSTFTCLFLFIDINDVILIFWDYLFMTTFLIYDHLLQNSLLNNKMNIKHEYQLHNALNK